MVVEGKRWRINYPWSQREQVFLHLSNLSHPPTTPLLKSFIAHKNMQSFHLFTKETLHQLLGKTSKRTLSVINPLVISGPKQSPSSFLTIFVVDPKNYVSILLCATQSLPLSIIMGKSGWKENSQLRGREDKLEPILSPKTSLPPRGRNASPYGSTQLSFSFIPTHSQRIPQRIINWKLANPQLLPWHWCPIP